MSRSVKKGPFAAPELLKRVDEMNKAGEKKVLKTWSRSSTIFPSFVGHTFAVHDGRKHMIRGKDTKIAEAYMANTPKAGCELMLKLLKSACANAENNFEMDPDNLYVAEAYATAGPILKRGRPRAQGRMYRINKRTSHITIVVAEKA